MKQAQALEEAREFIAACSGLGDSRVLRIMAASAPEDCELTLGTLRALAEMAARQSGPEVVTLHEVHRNPEYETGYVTDPVVRLEAVIQDRAEDGWRIASVLPAQSGVIVIWER